MPKSASKLIIGSLFIILVSFLTFLPSFNLALFGDDWLAIWRYLEHLGPKSPGQWNYLTYFLTPYGAQDILMGFLRNLYGFNSFYYYLTSFVFRLFAAFSLYPLVFYLTKSKLASLFSILFFSITIIGLETTNWVFNMPSYITIGLFNLTLYFFIKSREESHLKKIFISAILYYSAYIITPIRMHGSLPLLFLLEVLWIIQKRSLKIFKQSLLRFTIMLIIFLIIKFTGQSLGPSNEIQERLIQGFNTSITLLTYGRLDFIFHPLIMFGSMIVPDFLIQQMVGITNISFITLFFSILFIFLFIILCLILTNISKETNKKFVLEFISASLIWTLISWVLFPKNTQPFPNNSIIPSATLILANIGGYVSIFLILLFKRNWLKERISTALFISLIWPILSFAAAWWFTPQVIFPTTYRYLIFSAVGISICLGSIISLGNSFRKQLLLVSFLSLLLVLHLISTNNYFNIMKNIRNQQIVDKIWSSIPYIPETGKEPLVFYFESDNNNYSVLYHTVTFGFPPHMQLLYHLSQYDMAPVPMENWTEVVSAVKDGQSFKPYGYPLKPISINNIYAFHLQGQDNLIDITKAARQKLMEEKLNK